MSKTSSISHPRSRRLWLLPLLIGIGLVIGAVQPWGVEELLEFGSSLGQAPWFLAAVVLIMIVMFTFGLPGSLGLWLIAPFQAPFMATVLLLIGSVGGAVGAYHFSARLRGKWKPRGSSSRIVSLLSRQGGVLTQIAMRVLPGFPHSVLNFAGGVLGLKLRDFLLAAVVGLSIKWGIYASAVHGVMEAVEAGEALSFRTLLPLLVLSGLLLAGVMAKRWVVDRAD